MEIKTFHLKVSGRNNYPSLFQTGWRSNSYSGKSLLDHRRFESCLNSSGCGDDAHVVSSGFPHKWWITIESQLRDGNLPPPPNLCACVHVQVNEFAGRTEDGQMAAVTQDFGPTWKRVVFDVRWADTPKMTAWFGTQPFITRLEGRVCRAHLCARLRFKVIWNINEVYLDSKRKVVFFFLLQ